VLIEYSRINCNIANWDVSIAAARKSLELDPVSVYANHWLGHVLYFARRLEEAIPVLRQALELDPHYPKPHYFISMSYLWMGDPESALKEIQKEPLAWMRLTASSLILHRLSRSEEAQTAFDELVKLGLEDDCSIQQAAIYVQMGEYELAMGMFDRAIELSDPGLTQLLIDPMFDPIREDKRFIELLVKAGLAES
jgi:tetratricopeptide (TPR) repeat protein